MSGILYEHPLNERIRIYLKLEQFFTHVINCHARDMTNQHQFFFTSLFTIIDTLERNDVRGELIKDLEKLEQQLVVWSQSPEIDDDMLEDNLRQVVTLICQLKCPKAAWHQLKEDKFLDSVKQRFAIQGGNACFDLPQLQFWLHLPVTTIKADIQRWLSYLEQIQHAIDLILKFIRQRDTFHAINTDSGFYQDSGEGILLLRIKVPENAKYYPTVSGNRFRYSIRFMSPCQLQGRRYVKTPVEFELSSC